MRSTVLATVFALVLAGLGQHTHAATYDVDATHTFIHYTVDHLGVAPNMGRFDAAKGTIDFTPDDLGAASVKVVVDASSLDTGNDKRDGHLKSADFLNVEQYPTITFTAEGFEAVEGEADTWLVPGTLSLHGVTQDIEVTVHKTGEGEGMQGEQRIGFRTTFTIKRSDYGMDKMIPAIGDEVTMDIIIEGVKQE
jgi:polyisoprenoid-binding protein YceI